MTLPLPSPPLKRFSVHAAFSYSSAQADYVGRVGAALPKEIKIHDYKTREGTIRVVGHNLRKTLKRIYKFEAMFVFAFISKAYADKDSEFTHIEWEAAQRAARRKPGYVIPVLIEKTDMSILDTGLDGTLPPEQLADLIAGTIRRPPPAPWWFHLTTEVKIAAAAALLALVLLAHPAYVWIWPSRTSIKSVDVNAQEITVHIANNGPKSSTLVSQRLKFGALPIKDTELRRDKSKSPTIAPGERDIKLTVLTLEPKCEADGSRLNNAEIVPLLGTQPIMLEADFQESNDAPGHPTTRAVSIPAARLHEFIGKWVPSRVPPC